MITIGEILILTIGIPTIAIITFTVCLWFGDILDNKCINKKPINGREYVEKYGGCPICEDCPHNCPLEREENKNDGE